MKMAERQIAAEYGVPLLASLPLDRGIREQMDAGQPTVMAQPNSPVTALYLQMADKIRAVLAQEGDGRCASISQYTNFRRLNGKTKVSIKADKWIRRMAQEQGMIEPYESGQVRTGEGGRSPDFLRDFQLRLRCALFQRVQGFHQYQLCYSRP